MAVPGSAASFVTEITLTIGSRTVRIPAHEFLQSIDFESVSLGAWKGTVTLFDADGEFLEDLLIAAGIDRDLAVRFNWDDRPLSDAPIFRGRILVPNHTFMSTGIMLVLELTAKEVADAVLDKKVRSFEPGLKISDMVSQIAADRGWAVTDRFGRPTIEPTRDAMTEPFATSTESDVRFIEEQLRPQAVNSNGVAGYKFFFDQEGAVHFHTPTFIPQIAKRYIFARDPNGEVISFSPSETSYLAHLFGAARSETQAAASLPASAVSADTTIDKPVDGTVDEVSADSSAVLDIGSRVPNRTAVTARDADELSRITADRRARLSEQHITAKLDVLGTHDLRVLDYVDFVYTTRNGTPHYLSGRYLIQKIRHRLDTSGWRTTFSLSKHGFQRQPGTIPRTSFRSVTPRETS